LVSKLLERRPTLERLHTFLMPCLVPKRGIAESDLTPLHAPTENKKLI
jgi:hypothetical protein